MFGFISENNRPQEDQQHLLNQSVAINGQCEQQQNQIQQQPYHQHYGNFNNFPENELAQFASDLAYVSSGDCANNVQYPSGVDYIHDEQRALLHSSMSPLLAAVNAEFSVVHDSYTKPLEYLVITDCPIPSRAKASLPTQYLQFGANDATTNEPVVCAKLCVPQRTKFGPFEGDIEYISDLDLDVLNVQTPRYYPLLMIDDSHILNTSNENTTNWMRYVRLAESFAQQNLTLCLENKQIFFVTSRTVLSNEELRVGYDDSYASRFLLPKLQMRPIEHCLPEHILQTNGHEQATAAPRRTLRSPSKRQRRSVQLPEVVSKTGTTALKKRGRTRKIVFKCNLCAKRYGKANKLELHKLTHSEQQCRKPLSCAVCHQKCSTATALAAHLHSHYNRLYTCVYCEQTYKYVRAFKQHVTCHQSENGSYECLLCNKHYGAYHLVRKHVRLFHSSQHYRCDKCDKIFQNISTLQRHKLSHATRRRYHCAACSQTFRRSDHLQSHLKHVHSQLRVRPAGDRTTSKATQPVALPSMAKPNESAWLAAQPSEGSQYLKLSPAKVTGTSSSNRRKQVPTKLKASDLNKHSEACKAAAMPFLISEQDLHEEFTKSDDFVSTKVQSATTKPKDVAIVTTAATEVKPSQGSDSKAAAEHVKVKSPPLFRCHLCSHGNFKRRGILVNHLIRLHPNVNLKDIASLSEPVLKPQLRFPCSHCSNTYMSNIKRKEHMRKHHPGEPLPPSMRSCHNAAEKRAQIVGTYAAPIHECHQCPRQYSNRSRLLAHYRKHHPRASVPLAPFSDALPAAHEEKLAKDCAQKPTEDGYVCSQPTQHDGMRSTSLAAASLLQPQPASPENKLLKLSSAATLELSRFDFFNERAGPDDLNRLPALFAESPLVGMDDEKYTQRTIELQFFEKIGKL